MSQGNEQKDNYLLDVRGRILVVALVAGRS
jgi:hypothetical protein